MPPEESSSLSGTCLTLLSLLNGNSIANRRNLNYPLIGETFGDLLIHGNTGEKRTFCITQLSSEEILLNRCQRVWSGMIGAGVNLEKP